MGDIELVADNVDELINLFEKHLFRSSSNQAFNTYIVLVERVNKFYNQEIDLDITIREKILTFLLNLRVNHLGQIACNPKSEDIGIACVGNDTYLTTIPFSPYVLCSECICNNNDNRSSSLLASPPTSPSIYSEQINFHTVDLNEMFKVIFKCLRLENDWSIIKMVLRRLRLFIVNNPEVFKFTCYQKDLNDGGSTVTSNANAGAYESSPNHRSLANNLVKTACSLISDKRSFATQGNLDARSVKTEFEILVYQLLEVLIVHGKILDLQQKRKLVETIALGLLNSRYTKQTINSLTFCMMEMQDPKMSETFKKILLDLSKTSQSKSFALPKLNFLSNFILFPNLYSNFSDSEYLYIFAIAIPYTSYPEFDAFTVALAHRVVGMWFLTCKLPYRKSVVGYIYTNLALGAEKSYRNRSQSSGASIGNGRSPDPLSRPPHTPGHISRHPNSPSSFSTHSSSSNTNFFFSDSSSIPNLRHASSQASQATATSNSQVNSSSSALSNANSFDHQVQKELFETCIDLLQRYTYGSCSSIPPNHPYAHLLVDRSMAKSWLLGSSTITISTSGCQSRILADGLCRKCLDHFRSFTNNDDNHSSSASMSAHHSERRRHQSDFQRRTGVAPLSSNPSIMSSNTKSLRSMDDSHLSSLEFAAPSNSDYARERTCSCWCQGWAEIVIRQPTGKIVSMMRLTNSLSLPMSNIGLTSDLFNLYDPQFLNFDRTIFEQNKVDDAFDDSANTENNLNDDLTHDATVSSSVAVATTNATAVADQLASCHPRGSIDHSNISGDNECKDLPSSDSQIDIGVEPLLLPASGRNSSEDGTTDGIVTSSIDNNIAFNSNDSNSGTSGMATESSSSSSVFSSSSTSSVNSTISTAGGSGGSSGNCAIGTGNSHSHSSNNNTNNRDSNIGHNNCSQWSNNISKQKIARAQSLGQSDRTRVSPDKVHRPELTIPNSSLISSIDCSDQTVTAPPVLTSSGNVFAPLSTTSSSSSLIRQRSHTVSGQQGQRHTVLGSTSNYLGSNSFLPSSASSNATGYSEPKIHGISPQFVFLKLYNPSAIHGSEKPLLLTGDKLNRAIRNIDLIFPFETHKIAIVYVGLGQEDTKSAILANEHGSLRYQEMLSRIGNLQRLQQVDETTCFIGGLDKSGKDGKFVLCWHDNLTQVVFHVATLMPNDVVKDKLFIGKLKHIGNDSVVIVYNDSGRSFDRNTLSSEFLRFYIVVTPLGCGLNHVRIQTDPDTARIMGVPESCRLSDENLPHYIRQIAIQANLLFTQQLHSQPGGIPFISNWVERLRRLKSLRDKANEELNSAKDKTSMSNRTQSETHNRPVPPLNIFDYPDDFTKYTT